MVCLCVAVVEKGGDGGEGHERPVCSGGGVGYAAKQSWWYSVLYEAPCKAVHERVTRDREVV
jgi:hypothetical protein